MSDVKISELNLTETLYGNESVPVVQDGETKRALASSFGGKVLTSNIAYVDQNGNDSTAVGGDASKPFKTAQAAYDKLNQTPDVKSVIKLGIGDFTLNLTNDYNSKIQILGVSKDTSILYINGEGEATRQEDQHGKRGKNITLTSDQSVTFKINAKGSDGTGLDFFESGNGGTGGNVSLTNCRCSEIKTEGGNGGAGGIDSKGGNGGECGAVTLTDCVVTTISVNGGNGAVGNYGDQGDGENVGVGASTGAISIKNSTVESINAYSGMDGNSSPLHGWNRDIAIDNSKINSLSYETHSSANFYFKNSEITNLNEGTQMCGSVDIMMQNCRYRSINTNGPTVVHDIGIDGVDGSSPSSNIKLAF